MSAMRVGSIPENVIETVALAAGLVPTPVIETLAAAALARTLMAATELGIFEALERDALDAPAVAARCHTHPDATRKLLMALAGSGYLESRDGRTFALSTVARRWMLESSRPSVRDHVRLMYVVWRWLEHYEDYVRTGRALDVHRDLAPEEWNLYQQGMRSLAALVAPEVARRTPVPRRAERMLDIGGSHGLFSVALCRRHPRLSATVLDLPDAIAAAAPLLAREGMGGRVVHEPGDALVADLGTQKYDVVLVANLVHHFDHSQNRDLARRIERSLRPGGVLVVQDMERPAKPGDAGAFGALADLYFAALSASGTWSLEEIASWQAEAGLAPLKPVRMLTAPGVAQQSARKR